MSLKDIEELFDYDSWANGLVFDAAARLADEELRRDLSTSHESVFGTLVHIVGAEEVWLARWQKEPAKGLPAVSEFETLDALRSRWEGIRRERDAFVSSLEGDDALADELEVTTLAGGAYRHTFQEMFHHVVNHSSYHRGQIVTLLRQLGAEPPATDLIRYHRR